MESGGERQDDIKSEKVKNGCFIKKNVGGQVEQLGSYILEAVDSLKTDSRANVIYSL